VKRPGCAASTCTPAALHKASKVQLTSMLAAPHTLVAQVWLQGWWADLEGVLGEGPEGSKGMAKHRDVAKVHRIDL